MSTATENKMDLVNFNMAVQEREELEEKKLKNRDYLKKREALNLALGYDLMEDFAFELDHHTGQKVLLHVKGVRKYPVPLRAQSIVASESEKYELIMVAEIPKNFSKDPIQKSRDLTKDKGSLNGNERYFPWVAQNTFLKEIFSGGFKRGNDLWWMVDPNIFGLELRNYAYNFLPEEKRDLIKDLFPFQRFAEKPPEITFLIGDAQVDPYLEEYKKTHKTAGLPW